MTDDLHERSTTMLRAQAELREAKAAQRRWERILLWSKVGWVVVCGALLVFVLVSCAPAPAEPAVPSIGAWTTVTARPGLTPSHVGACVTDIDTATAAELVAARNAAKYSYGPLPQAGFPYDVPTSTLNCERVMG